MGLFKNLFNSIKEKKANKEEEQFNNLSTESKLDYLNKVKSLSEDKLEKTIEKRPYLLPHIISDLDVNNYIKLIDIATQKGVDLFDLIDKNSVIDNNTIINVAVENQPELVLELDDMPNLQEMITPETLIKAFVKNPEVLFSNCPALNKKIVLRGQNQEGEEAKRSSTLRVQLQRAMNLYFRPEAYMKNGFDNFARSIAEQINNEKFAEIVAGNKMTTRVTTAANETLKRNPEKGRVVPAKTLHKWNNRVMYTVPNEVRKGLKKSKVSYETYTKYLSGLLSNPSLNSFTKEERTRLVKRCVSIVPELFFELKSLNHVDSAGKLTVQLSAYEAFKTMKKYDYADTLLDFIGKEQSKKVLAKSKANATRKANKKAKKVHISDKEMALDRYKY